MHKGIAVLSVPLKFYIEIYCKGLLSLYLTDYLSQRSVALTFQEVFYIYLYDHKWQQRAVESNFLCHGHLHRRHILSGLSLSKLVSI